MPKSALRSGESGSMPQVQEDSGFMQDHKGRKHKEKDIERLYSVHCKLFPGRGLGDFLKQV